VAIGDEWIEPVTNRRQSDVDRARKYVDSMKGRYEALSEMKGCLNISDLNRIENNIKYLADILSLSLASKEWAVSEIPTSSDESRIIGNTSSLLSAISMENPPSIPDNLHSYSDFNEIEDILLTIYENIHSYDEAKIAVVLLDENDEPTDTVEYFDVLEDDPYYYNTIKAVSSYLNDNNTNRYLVNIGKRTGIDTLINYGFSRCSGLVLINIPVGVISIGRSTFEQTSLNSITLPDGLTSIGMVAFNGCKSLKSATIPTGINSLPVGIFNDCPALTTVNIPNGVTSIGDGAFSQCSSLVNLHIPDGVTSIGQGAISACLSLTNISIPYGVSSLESSVLAGCTSLREIEIPSSVISIKEYALAETSLTQLYIPGSVTTISSSSFGGCFGLLAITINKPENSISGAPWGAPNATVVWTG
jgi:hypothetical protein